MKRLHILNGDSSASLLAQANIPGDYLIWREALVDGPVQNWAETTTFLKDRSNFIVQAWGGTSEDYQEKFVPEFRKLEAANEYEEIVLWFEYDLFCQVNLMFLLNWFALHPPSARLSLICPGSHSEEKPNYGLGQLSSGQLAALFPERELLLPPTLIQGAALWQAFAGPDPLALQALIAQPNAGLPHVQSAFGGHLEEFPALQDGLSASERFLIQFLEAGPAHQNELFAAWREALPIYGWGDLQFFARLKALMPHWVISEEKGNVRLTQAGQQLLKGNGVRTDTNFSEKWLGGCKIGANMLSFRWDLLTERLIPAT